MGRTYILAVAPEEKVLKAIDELAANGVDIEDATLLSTKGFRHPLVTSYEDLTVPSLSEEQTASFSHCQRLIVIQYNQTLISYINVYRFLRANNVREFEIKCAGKPLLETSINRVFDHFRDDQNSSTENIHWISPESITLRHEFTPAHHGAVIDGDWDTNVVDFEQTVSFYHSLKLYLEENRPWVQTDYYKDVVSSLDNGEARFGCRDLKSFEKHLAKVEQLVNSIRQNGWQQAPGDDFVTINIGRKGQLIFNDGRHRLAIAKLLKLEKIPVKIAVRHQHWVEFKQEIKAFAAKFYDGKVYAKLNHPDLAEFEFRQHDNRFELIREHVSPGMQTVLDIGCHWGYFCQSLQQEGYSCTGIEADVNNFYFLKKLKEAQGQTFRAICGSVFDVVGQDNQYDVVLALNIFHHFLKTEEKYQQLIALLERLNCREMFLQTHSADEPQMEGAFANYHGHAFADFVSIHAGFTSVELLKSYDNGRMMFKLAR